MYFRLEILRYDFASKHRTNGQLRIYFPLCRGELPDWLLSDCHDKWPIMMPVCTARLLCAPLEFSIAMAMASTIDTALLRFGFNAYQSGQTFGRKVRHCPFAFRCLSARSRSFSPCPPSSDSCQCSFCSVCWQKTFNFPAALRRLSSSTSPAWWTSTSICIWSCAIKLVVVVVSFQLFCEWSSSRLSFAPFLVSAG